MTAEIVLAEVLNYVGSADSVGVFTQDFKQVFRKARPLKADVKEESKVMEHPLETGATITDYRIIQPVEIELSLILSSVDYKDTYQEIKQLYLNATLLIVQTQSGTYDNQLIKSMSHDESPDYIGALKMQLTLKQAQFVQPEFSMIQPKDKKKSSTVRRGNVQPKTVPDNKEVDTAVLHLFKPKDYDAVVGKH